MSIRAFFKPAPAETSDTSPVPALGAGPSKTAPEHAPSPATAGGSLKTKSASAAASPIEQPAAKPKPKASPKAAAAPKPSPKAAAAPKPKPKAAASKPTFEARDWLAPTASAMRVEYRYPADDKWYRGVLAPIPAEGGEVNMLYVDENAMEVINLDADDLDEVRARLRAPGSGEIVWEAKHDKLAKKKAGKEGWTSLDEEWQTSGHEWMGARVRVPTGVCATVTRWLPANDDGDEAIWHAQHDDGDGEDLDAGEMEAALAAFADAPEEAPPAKKRQKQVSKKAAAVAAKAKAPPPSDDDEEEEEEESEDDGAMDEDDDFEAAPKKAPKASTSRGAGSSKRVASPRREAPAAKKPATAKAKAKAPQPSAKATGKRVAREPSDDDEEEASDDGAPEAAAAAPEAAATRPQPAERWMQAAHLVTRLPTPVETKARILELHDAGKTPEQIHGDLYRRQYKNSANNSWGKNFSSEKGKINRVLDAAAP